MDLTKGVLKASRKCCSPLSLTINLIICCILTPILFFGFISLLLWNPIFFFGGAFTPTTCTIISRYPSGHYNVTFIASNSVYSGVNKDVEFKPIYLNGQHVPCFYGNDPQGIDKHNVYLQQYANSIFQNVYWIGILLAALVPGSLGSVCLLIGSVSLCVV
eukprot:gene3818-6979_t